MQALYSCHIYRSPSEERINIIRFGLAAGMFIIQFFSEGQQHDIWISTKYQFIWESKVDFSENTVTAGFQSANNKRLRRYMQTFSNAYGFSPLFHLIIIYLPLLGYKNNVNYIYLAYDCSIFFICIEIAVIVLRIIKYNFFGEAPSFLVYFRKILAYVYIQKATK